ncbi:O-antigen ligase family protein [Aquimarina sediminis]|uniref:O-antigen ligase family protein n=1 Tax=Aquimarina sediminis TaxID=2070536 RepID=UPI000CA08B33|nr:O-antigen ligase family protein [Aquimarina sediminis]
MKINIAKASLTTLLLSFPFNFIVLSGMGNIYLSTLMVLFQFLVMLVLTKGRLVNNNITLIAVLVFSLVFFSTGINILSNKMLINEQITKTVIYFQNVLALILMTYYIRALSLKYILNLFLVIVIFVSLRVFLEEPDHVFRLSVLWGERIEAEFVAGVNTFAIFNGLGLVISFFYLKKKSLRIFLCLLFLLIILLTMSRGALIAAVFTLFITALYDVKRETFNAIIKYSVIGVIAGMAILIFSGKMDEIVYQLNTRFLSFLDGKTSLDTFFAGRGTLIGYVFNEFINSSIFQMLFGHGNGSMDFTIPETGQEFETSHLVVFDILYRNGLVLTLLYLYLLFVILYRFLKRRKREKIVLFGLFVFFHLELLVNPMIFSAQSGWLYSLFLILFIKQDKLNFNEER